jgi:mRNA interferase MazF
MNVTRGDVVLVDYPYSDRTGSKVRPTLVVSTPEVNSGDDAIIAAITSRVSANLKASEILVDVSRPHARGSGLLSRSVIECWNVLTIDRKFLLRRIGHLPRGAMKRVDDAWRMSGGPTAPTKTRPEFPPR